MKQFVWLPIDQLWIKVVFIFSFFQDNCRFGIFEQFWDFFTLGQVLIRALFQYFFLRRPASEARLSNFIFDAFGTGSIMVCFEKKIFKCWSTQGLRCQSFHFWNAHVSLVGAPIFASSGSLRPCCQWLFEMVWHLKICTKVRVLEPILYFCDIFIET